MMRMCILTGGQTGVDRGAFYGALAAGIEVDGFVPQDKADETGMIPGEIVDRLRVSPRAGLLARSIRNVELADVVVALVEDATNPYRTPGTIATLQYARKLDKPRVVADPSTPVSQLRRMTWDALSRADARRLRIADCVGVMVCGPRASKWPGGEAFAHCFVAQLVEIVRAIDG